MSDTPSETPEERVTEPTPEAPLTVDQAPVAPIALGPAGDTALSGPYVNAPTLSDSMNGSTSTPLRDPTAYASRVMAEAPPAPAGRANRALWSTRISLLLVAALVGGLAGHFASPAASSGGGVTIDQVSNAPGAAVLPNGTSIPKLVQRALPSIVSIDVNGNGEEDQGTGMIISKGGLVVTNNHVIAAAVNGGSITITRSGSTASQPATLVGTNPIDDVALIRIDRATNLPTVTFGNSNALEAGDAVVAIGNALGLAAGTPTVTQGIVSALGRTVTAGSSTASETLNNMIQTDAAINPGNSGGPLLDSAGNVIGMNTAVAGTLANGENTQNIGFAIPTATIESLLKSLMAGESVVNHGAFIGVEIESMNPTLQQEYGFKVTQGAVVMSVIAGTGAAAAGVKQGDIIVGINKTTIASAQDVTAVVSSLRPGDQVVLHIVRGTKHLSLTVTLSHVPSS